LIGTIIGCLLALMIPSDADGRVVSSLELGEELWFDLNVLDFTDGAAHAELVLLEEVAELIAVDQVNRRSAVARCLSLGFGR
jgi:hypothetical protein